MVSKKKTENVVIPMSEYTSLLRQSAMLFTILHSAPGERAAVVESVARGMAKPPKGGGKNG